MSRWNPRLWLVVTSLAATAAALAEDRVPLGTGFSYQGYLTQAGQPFTGMVSVAGQLYNVDGGVTPIAVDVQGPVSVVDGLFMVEFDFGSAVIDGQALWLEIVLNGVPIAPRQPLSPTPYALYALNAPSGNSLDAFDGSPADALFVDANGRVGIGVTTPRAELELRSDNANRAARVLAASKSGETWVMLWSGFNDGANDPAILWSDNAVSDDLRFLTGDPNGTSAVELMRLFGTGELQTRGPDSGFAATNPNNAGARISLDWYRDDFGTPDPNDDIDIPRLRAGGNGAGALNGLDIQTTSDRSLMRLLHNGNVGIDNDLPETRLHILDGSDVEPASGGFLQMGPTAAENLALDNNEIMARNNGAPGVLNLNINGGDLLACRDGGNVGIGVPTAQRKLHVGGNGGVIAMEGSDHCYLEFYPDTFAGGRKAYVGFATGTDDNLQIANQVSGADIYLNTNNGNVGIETSAPAARLHVEGTGRFDGLLAVHDGGNVARVGLEQDGELRLYNSGGIESASLLSAYQQTVPLQITYNAQLLLRDPNGLTLAALGGPRGLVPLGTPIGPFLSLNNFAGNQQLGLYGSGQMYVRDPNGLLEVLIQAESVGGSAKFEMFSDGGAESVELIADEGDDAGQLVLRDNGVNAIVMDADEGGADGGADISLYRPGVSDPVISIDADYGSTGDARITTETLEISGGSDFSEQFDIDASLARDGQRIEPMPGMIVSIDAEREGVLRVSTEAYDRTVAGIISGAGGVKPGLLMGQRGTAADGAHPVALSGRVYVWADASYGAIKPGDLLTTSDTPGHAMRVSDHAAAPGAILGKAMGRLESGRGLVLVLVNLH